MRQLNKLLNREEVKYLLPKTNYNSIEYRNKEGLKMIIKIEYLYSTYILQIFKFNSKDNFIGYLFKSIDGKKKIKLFTDVRKNLKKIIKEYEL